MAAYFIAQVSIQVRYRPTNKVLQFLMSTAVVSVDEQPLVRGGLHPNGPSTI